MKRIGIDYNLATTSCRGMGRYIREIVSCLIFSDKSNMYYLYTSRPINITLPFNFIEKRLPCNNTILIEQFFLPLFACRDHLDILWCPANTFPLFPLRKTKLAVTIHDLIFCNNLNTLSLHQRIGQLYRRFVVINGKNRIKYCITVSKYSQTEIRQKLGIKHVYITYNKIDSFYELSKNIAIEEKDRKDFYFTVSGDAPSKNLKTLIEVFECLPDRYLIIAGVPAESPIRTRSTQNILFLEYGISDSELIYYYKTCRAFIFISLYEGFGIPVLEAMACNAPIICSNTTSVPEVAGKYAILVDPKDKEAILNAVMNVKNKWEVPKPGISHHLRKFLNWQDSADIILQMFMES